MNQDLINRYQIGGDIYAALLAKYGQGKADAIATAALSGDSPTVTAAVASAQYGAPLDASTAAIFTNQMLTDPLAAPLASLDNLTKNSILDFLKSPAVLLVVGIAAFFALGGSAVIQKQFNKLK